MIQVDGIFAQSGIPPEYTFSNVTVDLVNPKVGDIPNNYIRLYFTGLIDGKLKTITYFDDPNIYYPDDYVNKEVLSFELQLLDGSCFSVVNQHEYSVPIDINSASYRSYLFSGESIAICVLENSGNENQDKNISIQVG